MSDVRVRFAPSPTGDLHVGGLRTLLFNWLYAKKTSGKLILRVEDTDQVRSFRHFEDAILKAVDELGLVADEGPIQGGPHAPYRQSERMQQFANHVEILRKQGQVYPCFCTDDIITKKREAALKLGKTPHYDGTCARIPLIEAEQRLKNGEKAGKRFRAFQKNMILHDLVKGDVEFKQGMVGDFFITRAPSEGEKEMGIGIGMPVYNFSCVLDDHLMEMTHIIRGEDHLSNSARQLMIYEAFGWKPPLFAHIPMVLGADRQKLSKRTGDTSVIDYLNKGYLEDALLNFLVLLGWWPPNEYKPKSGHPEILSREELVQIFNIEGIQKSPAVFDVQKLNWMNSHYIRHIELDTLLKKSMPFFEASGWKPRMAEKGDQWMYGVLESIRGNIQLLSELPAAAEMFFSKEIIIEPDAKDLLKLSDSGKVVAALFDSASLLGEQILAEDVDQLQKDVALKTGIKGKSLFMPIRAAVTGRTHGPEMKKVLPLLGKEIVLARIESTRRQVGL